MATTNTTDVVETVLSEPETWLKFRDETETLSKKPRPVEVRNRDSRPHIFLMIIKANSLNNAATKFLAHCQISR